MKLLVNDVFSVDANFYEFEEDATGGGEFVKVITRNLINNKWVSKTKKYKIDDYYKD